MIHNNLAIKGHIRPSSTVNDEDSLFTC